MVEHLDEEEEDLTGLGATLPDLLTSTDVAHLLGLHPNTIAKWRIKGVGPDYIRLPGSKVIYTRKSVYKFLNFCCSARSDFDPLIFARLDKRLQATQVTNNGITKESRNIQVNVPPGKANKDYVCLPDGTYHIIDDHDREDWRRIMELLKDNPEALEKFKKSHGIT